MVLRIGKIFTDGRKSESMQVLLSANIVYFGLDLGTLTSNSGVSTCKFLTQIIPPGNL
jgi:hypothetical protein